MYAAIVPLLSQKLSGFLKGHSCSTAISSKMTEGWRAVVAVDLMPPAKHLIESTTTSCWIN